MLQYDCQRCLNKGDNEVRVITVTIPANFNDMGLARINMDRLGKTVVIAGKNGSGKTRLLKLIEYLVHYDIDEMDFYEDGKDISSLKKRIAEENSLANKKRLEAQLNAIHGKHDILNYLEYDHKTKKRRAINFVPSEMELQDSAKLGIADLQKRHASCMDVGVSNLNSKTLPYIQYEAMRYFNSQNSMIDTVNNEKEAIERSYKRLNQLIFEFLGTNLDYTINGICTIFGFELGYSNLSEGQKVLLQLCVALHAQEASLDNVILLLDEPENHLHPSALIDFVSGVLNVLNNGQLFIATHSITLLSYLNSSDIWYMDNNDISYGGKIPDKVLKGLVGDDTRISKLRDFLCLPAELASNEFAYECLFYPEAVFTKPEDKQTLQIINQISQNKKTRILDYGAGKGRLANAIYYNKMIFDNDNLKEVIEYIAFDKFEEDKENCEDSITRLYGDCHNKYFNHMDDVLKSFNENSFDFVIMSNVLHEIPIIEWKEDFKSIYKLLNDEGHIIIIEDLLIPVGENPHKNGFILLGLEQMKILFGVLDCDTDFNYSDADNRERLLAYKVPRKYLKRISDQTINQALESLKAKAKAEILKLRGYTDYKNGRLHGLWCQLLVNTILNLEE